LPPKREHAARTSPRPLRRAHRRLPERGPAQRAIRARKRRVRGQHERALVTYRQRTAVSFEGNPSCRLLFGPVLSVGTFVRLWHEAACESARRAVVTAFGARP